jgi:hypothetical protein
LLLIVLRGVPYADGGVFAHLLYSWFSLSSINDGPSQRILAHRRGLSTGPVEVRIGKMAWEIHVDGSRDHLYNVFLHIESLSLWKMKDC